MQLVWSFVIFIAARYIELTILLVARPMAQASNLVSMPTSAEAINMRRLLICLTLFPVSCLYAQSRLDSSNRTGSIRVRLASSNGHTCDFQASVLLMSISGARIAKESTNADCEVSFPNVSAGSYHVTVSGAGIEDADSGRFDFDSTGHQDVEVNIKHAGGMNQSGGTRSSNPLVAAVDLNIPQGAHKEFDKANQFAAKGNWQKAIERLNKAIAIYPRYAEAYNNLGVAYGHLGDRAKNIEALQKAITLNDHFAAAYLNLARVAIVDRDFPRAENLLSKATAIDPIDPQILGPLANMQLLNRHYDQAIATCRRAHSSSRGEHAVVHYVAARVFEQENRPEDALAELQIFLAEEQSGPRADRARKEMIALQQGPGTVASAQ
jgi:tetratricopeptide (TPR) repeat protein